MFDVWLPINLIISALAIKIDVREKKNCPITTFSSYKIVPFFPDLAEAGCVP